MAAGYLVSCWDKRKNDVCCRLLRGKNATGRFIKQHVDLNDAVVVFQIQVQEFNSNGYLSTEYDGRDAVNEFC